jgi:Spy/CpxP family protein refolding chaperone
MKKTILCVLTVAALFVLPLFSTPSVAQDAPVASKTPKKDFISGKDQIDARFLALARRVIAHKKELNLSEEQVRLITNVVADTKVKLMEKNADIETVTVSFNTLVWENPFAIDNITKLAEEKRNLTIEREKLVISSLEKLGAILTPEQKQALGKITNSKSQITNKLQ